MADWRGDLLGMLGAPRTKQNLRMLATWQRWEGGHTNNDARFNWLNTTMDAPGADGEINSVGVKRFRSRREGINALAQTIMNGRYQDIIDGLRSGNPYAHDLSAGLSTWVSGSPTGNLKYAQKVMGGAGNPKGPSTRARPEPTRKGGSLPGPSMDKDLLRLAFPDDPDFVDQLLDISTPPARPVRRSAPRAPRTGDLPKPVKGKGIGIPMEWSATHVTDGLGWGTRSAVDIMGSPGTPVYLPEDVTVISWSPTGAQGGGSMRVRTKSGREYWLGHLANGVPPGTRVRAGSPLAVISPDHPRPHVHVDRRG